RLSLGERNTLRSRPYLTNATEPLKCAKIFPRAGIATTLPRRQGLADLIEADAQGDARDGVEVPLWPDEVEGAVRVDYPGAGREGRGGRRGFELVERAERLRARLRGTVVVGVDRVAAVRVLLDLPHRVDVVGGAGRQRVLDHSKYPVVGVVASER